MKKIEQYIRDQIKDPSILLKLEVVYDMVNEGFYIDMNNYWYVMHIPLDKTNLTWAVKLTVRHELGHIGFFCKADTLTLQFEMKQIREHKLFCFLQKIWYWNPAIRWVKRMLGFSTKINYKRNDIYMLRWTREDNELYADYFAWYGMGDK